MTALRKYTGMSDDQLANERMAREKLDAALQEMWRAIHAVNLGSSVVSIDTKAFAAFIHDEIPSSEGWDEKIAEARRA
jgi:hypothetical protein